MYRLLRRLRAYPYRKDAEQGEKYSFQRRGIEENKFILHLKFTRFLVNWRQTISEIPPHFGYPMPSSETGVIQIQKMSHLIDIVIEGCREKGYLEPKELNSRLKITSKGWRFSGFWLGGFLSECMREYKLAQLIIAGIIGGIPFGALILWLFQNL